ncbi:MAG: AsnC family transcriptional regulator, partial [Actinobacteria bacterium]|nr:AsnC family transcriptional regulator [Actinomycetota bacterium]
MALDDVDVELVDALRRDGRASFESLADTIGLSRRATRTRVQRILDDGVVRVVATVRPEFDGIHAIAHLSVGVSSTDRDEVARAITELDESVFVSIVSGQSAVVAEVRTATLTRLADVVDQVRGIAGVRDVDTVVYTDVLKEPHLPPPSALPGVGDCERAIDDLDRALVARLRTDGRASYADLAQQVGLSAAATRARVRRLIDL